MLDQILAKLSGLDKVELYEWKIGPWWFGFVQIGAPKIIRSGWTREHKIKLCFALPWKSVSFVSRFLETRFRCEIVVPTYHQPLLKLCWLWLIDLENQTNLKPLYNTLLKSSSYQIKNFIVLHTNKIL